MNDKNVLKLEFWSKDSFVSYKEAKTNNGIHTYSLNGFNFDLGKIKYTNHIKDESLLDVISIAFNTAEYLGARQSLNYVIIENKEVVFSTEYSEEFNVFYDAFTNCPLWKMDKQTAWEIITVEDINYSEYHNGTQLIDAWYLWHCACKYAITKMNTFESVL
jgi:hypothetical protein